MTNAFFAAHQATLNQALHAIAQRGYWSPYNEMPSPKTYGETAAADGEAAYKALLNHPFALEQAGSTGTAGNEQSPYGFPLGITYPKADPDALIAAMQKALPAWRKAGPEVWAGVCLEILARINKRSFEFAHAVMHTTGQAYMMAFQAGGPHAQDRGLEAVAYAYRALKEVPPTAHWEKPQGKNPPLAMHKRFTIVPRGIGLVIGCCTFPTWNGFPGLFANLATGNGVIVKPHHGAILPLALTVKIAREVLQEAGFDPHIVTLAVHTAGDNVAQTLALHPAVKIIDFTGSPQNGNWLERTAHQAQVYTEKAGVNQVVIDSTTDFKGLCRNLAFSLVLYSGQMCTAPQNIYVPKDGIATDEGHKSFEEVAQGIAGAVAKWGADAAKGVEVLGAIQNTSVTDRLEKAKDLGTVLLASQNLAHPNYPGARCVTPLMLTMTAADEAKFSQEWFGPISFVIATANTAQSLQLAEKLASQQGALTLACHSTNPAVKDAAHEVACNAGVSLSYNLTGTVLVNQSAAFSDFHGTGANPAANASLTDGAFVANRFRVVQDREHVTPAAA